MRNFGAHFLVGAHHVVGMNSPALRMRKRRMRTVTVLVVVSFVLALSQLGGTQFTGVSFAALLCAGFAVFLSVTAPEVDHHDRSN